MKIEVLTVNYNTPELVMQLFLTIFKYCSYNLNYTVINNGPIEFIDNNSIINVIDFKKEAKEYIDQCKKNSKIYLRPEKSVFGSVHHAYTIDYYIYNRSDADYILLFDTDVIIKENFDDKIKFLIESKQPLYSCLIFDDVSGAKFKRIAPHCCFINRKLFTELNLKFLTLDKFLDITHTYAYDTGRGLLENISNLNLQYFSDNSFFQHLKGISWKKAEGKLK